MQPVGVNGNSEGVKTKVFKGIYELKLNGTSREVGNSNQKSHCERGIDIFFRSIYWCSNNVSLLIHFT